MIEPGTHHPIKDWRVWVIIRHLWTWIMWSTILSIVPFIGAVGIHSFVSGKWAGWPSVIGAGQLLPTCIAIVVGGFRDLCRSHAAGPIPARESLMGGTIVTCIFAAGYYGSLIRATPSPTQMDLVAKVSGYGLLWSVLFGAILVTLATPKTSRAPSTPAAPSTPIPEPPSQDSQPGSPGPPVHGSDSTVPEPPEARGVSSRVK